ncbi:ECF transporter S component [Streptococcus pseudoporcinus]|uniref:Membrane protein n=1 Tax=Streptococcus pseudoporcinus TaxID=361101 RepID=A0A4U9XIQ8_9STRE|nr:ECF transporter S component [Streptococcus pseudoporcinus]VTS13083.1 membrane protein [Streptococcus pseudoporcinus]VUC66262.1 membrane protein [Streptococcus pseudoporcinus]VUC97189.1 membrane protein [Streptococcus pseudoporcinus]VUC97577.1 membrane protein [Streptococcus pseudoporcinus]
MSSKKIARIAILSALAFVLRMAFSHLPNIQPVTALFFIATISLSYYEAFLVMFISILITSILLGFGPWVFWQITTFTLIMATWRFLLFPLSRKIKSYRVLMQSFSAAFLALLYGFVIDSCFAYLYSMPWWTYVLSGLTFNLLHALSTFIFYPILLMLFRRLFNEKMV